MTKFYRPSNGTEGMIFTSHNCDICIFDDSISQYGEEKACTLLLNSMMYDINDPEYPQEWIYNEENYGICTKFILDGSKKAKNDQIKRNQKLLEKEGQQRLFKND